MASGAQMVTLIPIRKMDRALDFYTKALGAKIHMRGEGAMRNWWASLNVAGGEVWFIVPEKREKRALAYHAFMVKDIKKYVAQLQRRGVKFLKAERMSKETKIEGVIAFDTMGASAMFKDPEGNLLMIWQSPGGM